VSYLILLQVFLPELALYSQSLETELRLYRLTGGKVVTRAKDLPKGAVDIIITALEDQARYRSFCFCFKCGKSCTEPSVISIARLNLDPSLQ